jgi:hypothetical protein
MRLTLCGLFVLACVVTGCGKDEPKGKSGGVEINAPGISIKAGENGADVNAPGVNVKVKQ